MPHPLDAYDPIFKEAGEEWNVDPLLLRAMAGQESGGDPRALSKQALKD
jgi:soluble lytic murein transglycosylase-like protein